ncbi:hypothetical protein BDZ97DRAFT_354584 [Flammula alnicola]|nr:hypothetical protein BDZ97DRAFT_354584 [Flammula alnicola]
MSSANYARVSVTEQPRASDDLSMDLKASSVELTEKGLLGNGHNLTHAAHNHSCEQCHSTTSESDHRRCHNGRLRRFLAPFLIAVVLLGGLLAFRCLGGSSGWGMDTLVSRAIGDNTNNGGTFVHNKLYLIVLFVGLLLVVIFAIMLSAWCCRESIVLPMLPVCMLRRSCVPGVHRLWSMRCRCGADVKLMYRNDETGHFTIPMPNGLLTRLSFCRCIYCIPPESRRYTC